MIYFYSTEKQENMQGIFSFQMEYGIKKITLLKR